MGLMRVGRYAARRAPSIPSTSVPRMFLPKPSSIQCRTASGRTRCRGRSRPVTHLQPQTTADAPASRAIVRANVESARGRRETRGGVGAVRERLTAPLQARGMSLRSRREFRDSGNRHSSDVLRNWQRIVDLLVHIIRVPAAVVTTLEPPSCSNYRTLVSSKIIRGACRRSSTMVRELRSPFLCPVEPHTKTNPADR
jgi:hypothetical protein